MLPAGASYAARVCPPKQRAPAAAAERGNACRLLLVRVEFVHDGVAATTCDQPAVDGHRDDECDHEAEREAPPEEAVDEPGCHCARNDDDEGVVDDLHRRDRDGV